jgi:glycosyltransferase involved in cell wall biosynthesis
MTPYEFKVSVCCVAYNQEKLIVPAIESFLMQQTTFNFEILIGDDCSTDSTREVIAGYCSKYPDKIKLVSGKTNVGLVRNLSRVMKHAKGEYIALCDGDDYWTDPLKLQKQVDFLSQNLQYVVCCHYSKVVDAEDRLLNVEKRPVSFEYTYDDILIGRKKECRTSTIMVRNNEQTIQLTEQEWYKRVQSHSRFFLLFNTFVTQLKVYVLPEVMAAYRIHDDGIWSLKDSNFKKSKMLGDFKIMLDIFKSSSAQKRQLLYIYLKSYFLFDLKGFKFKSSVNTIYSLLQ